jgi:hypothetical protein
MQRDFQILALVYQYIVEELRNISPKVEKWFQMEGKVNFVQVTDIRHMVMEEFSFRRRAFCEAMAHTPW